MTGSADQLSLDVPPDEPATAVAGLHRVEALAGIIGGFVMPGGYDSWKKVPEGKKAKLRAVAERAILDAKREMEA